MLIVADLRRPGLAPVDLSLADAECIAVRGASGAGKSLLLPVIADLDSSEGDVRLDGVSRDEMPVPEWRRRVTYAAAEPDWWAETRLLHFPDPEKASALAEQLGLAREILGRPIAKLSTGERQGLSLARSQSLVARRAG
jgi:phosphate-transporting ATPase